MYYLLDFITVCIVIIALLLMVILFDMYDWNFEEIFFGEDD